MPPASSPATYGRIVSVTLGTDEMLVDLVEPQRIAALSPFCDVPYYSNVSKAAQAVPGRVMANAEQVLALNPDFVLLASYNNPEFVSLIQPADIGTGITQSFDNLDEVLSNLLRVGEWVGEQEKARALADEARSRIDRIKTSTVSLKKPTVLYFDHGWVAGADTIHDEMIRIAGGENYAAREGISGPQQIATEVLQMWQPEVVLIVGAETMQLTALTLPEDARGLKNLDAVANGRCYSIPARIFTSTSHYAAQGPEILASLLHPKASTQP